MREFFNAILAFIVSESLTDDEFATCKAVLPLYDQDTYQDLANVLTSRNSVSVYHDRLIAFYEAKGVNITPVKTGTSNIFLGAVL